MRIFLWPLMRMAFLSYVTLQWISSEPTKKAVMNSIRSLETELVSIASLTLSHSLSLALHNGGKVLKKISEFSRRNRIERGILWVLSFSLLSLIICVFESDLKLCTYDHSACL